MTAASHITVLIALNDDSVKTLDRLERCQMPYEEICDIIQEIACGDLRGKLLYHADAADGTAAADTIAWDGSDGVDGDTVTVCGVVLTAKTTASLDPALGQFALSSNDTTQATNFANCVNTHPALRYLVAVTNNTSTSTITMLDKGVHGNLGTLSTTNSELATIGAAAFAAGAAGTLAKALTVDTQCVNIVS